MEIRSIWADYRVVRAKAVPLPEMEGKYYETIFDYEKGVYDKNHPRLHKILEAYYIVEPNSIYEGLALFLGRCPLAVVYGCNARHIKEK